MSIRLTSDQWAERYFFLAATEHNSAIRGGVSVDDRTYARHVLESVPFLGGFHSAIIRRAELMLAADRAARIERWRQYRSRGKTPALVPIMAPTGDVVPFCRSYLTAKRDRINVSNVRCTL